MQSIEKEILNAITVNGVWIIILLVAIFVFCVGIYTLLKRLVKIEKEKNNLLEMILDNQAVQIENRNR